MEEAARPPRGGALARASEVLSWFAVAQRVYAALSDAWKPLLQLLSGGWRSVQVTLGQVADVLGNLIYAALIIVVVRLVVSNHRELSTLRRDLSKTLEDEVGRAQSQVWQFATNFLNSIQKKVDEALSKLPKRDE